MVPRRQGRTAPRGRAVRRVATWLAVASAVAVFLPFPAAPPVALLLAVLAALVLDRAVLRVGVRFGVALAVLSGAALAGAAVASSSGPTRGLAVAVTVLLRLLVLTLLTGLAARSISAEDLLATSARLGLDRLGLVVGLALNALPRLAEATREVWIAHRVRRRGRWSAVVGTPALAEVLLAHTGRIAAEAAAAAALRGHASRIASFPALAEPAPPLVVVSGRPGCGKTSSVLEAVTAMRTDGFRIAGFVQPARRREGETLAIWIHDLVTGEETLLADRVEPGSGEAGTRFRFHDGGWLAARAALARARVGDWLVIDELGPVELRGRGHLEVARAAATRPDLAGALIVVRRNLVPALLDALSLVPAAVVDLEAIPVGKRAAALRDAIDHAQR